MRDNTPYVEHEISKGKRKIFCIIDPQSEKIWIDTKGLPQSAFLCACCDGTETIRCQVGERQQFERYFLPMEWAINDWGGDKGIVEALKIRRKIIQDSMDEYKKMILPANDPGTCSE